MSDAGFRLNDDDKFDIQLAQGKIQERKLAELLVGADIELIEVKAESYIWERTGNLCIEFEWNGEPSRASRQDQGRRLGARHAARRGRRGDGLDPVQGVGTAQGAMLPPGVQGQAGSSAASATDGKSAVVLIRLSATYGR